MRRRTRWQLSSLRSWRTCAGTLRVRIIHTQLHTRHDTPEPPLSLSLHSARRPHWLARAGRRAIVADELVERSRQTEERSHDLFGAGDAEPALPVGEDFDRRKCVTS